MEQWKPILGYEGLYEISNLGNARRTARGKMFTAAEVEQAKQMLSKKAKLKDVAAFLKTSITTVMSIKQGKTWAGDAKYRVCKPTLLKGYFQLSLCKDGSYRRVGIHRAVWEAFNGPIKDRLEINHKDLNRSNNSLDNLELVTHQQNLKHAIDAYKAQGLLRAVKGTKGFIAGKHSAYENQ